MKSNSFMNNNIIKSENKSETMKLSSNKKIFNNKYN